MGVGVLLGGAEVVGEPEGSALVSPCCDSAQMVPPSTITSSAISAISGQVHGLRFFFSFSSAASSVGS